ncbi:formate dehydrogenase [Azohydromonas aeria]|uniref:formate dehydrogenase n=1 Tax=Azohydromonas aeria TaxID=2590212 RepID=UPI0012F8233F|nr:formate dehydrogenase [Azohydromonas aeria]
MTSRLPRRNLLAALACTPVAAAAATAGRAVPPAASPPARPEPDPSRPATYHETEHARRYYRSAARL